MGGGSKWPHQVVEEMHSVHALMTIALPIHSVQCLAALEKGQVRLKRGLGEDFKSPPHPRAILHSRKRNCDTIYRTGAEN